MKWYKDRDFPEVKRDGEILAYIPDPKELERIVEVHNQDIDYLMGIIEDKRELTRELDIALFGTDAARQASLCDLIGPAKELREELDKYKKALEAIAKVTYGTELCNTDEENNEILA